MLPAATGQGCERVSIVACFAARVRVLQEQEAVAAAVMASLPQVLQQQGLGQLQVTLQGLSTFRNQVRMRTST